MLWGSILPCADPGRLAAFYAALLGWSVAKDEPGWVTIEPPEGGTAYLGFQADADYSAAAWPPPDGTSTQVLQFDLGTADVDAAVERAVHLGASRPEYQPEPAVTVLLDPDGHAFCLLCSASRAADDATGEVTSTGG